MSEPTIDTNQWYYLYVNDDRRQALVGTNLYTSSGTKGAVFFNTTDTSANTQRWQIFPTTVNGTRVYTLRSKEGGPNAFMGAGYVQEEDTEGHTRPQMFRGDVADNGVYWNFGGWGDGTWFLSNGINGTSYHLNRKVNGLLAMSPNITAPQNGQRWNMAEIAKIDDEKYSSVNLKIATATTSRTTITASSISSPTSSTETSVNNNTSTGLSTGAQAAIGATVGGASLVALIILGLYFWKRRKQQNVYTPPPKLHEETYFPRDSTTQKYEMYGDGVAKYEMSSPDVVEVPNQERPAELPAITHR